MQTLGIVPHAVAPPDIDETPHQTETPQRYCARIARAKAQAIAPGAEDIVLCADTTVALGRRILGKPADADEARAFLTALSGRRHRVITHVVVRTADTLRERGVVSRVAMKRLSPLEIDAYLASDEWQGKAGGYSIQGRAGAFVPWLSGSYSAVVGLPLAQTAQLLQSAGIPVWNAP